MLSSNKSKNNSIVELLILGSAIFIAGFRYHIGVGNEMDVIPCAIQQYNPEWLPGDWYLNLDIHYRFLFNFIAGFLTDIFGITGGIIVGRILLYLLFTIAFHRLFKFLEINTLYGVLGILLFGLDQSMIAGASLVGTFETKYFAFVFILMAFVPFFKGKYLEFWLYMGLAINFHVLICLYSILAYGLVWLFSKSSWKELLLIISKSWIFPIVGLFGMYSFYIHFSDAVINTGGNSEGWLVYIKLALPFHLDPSYWPTFHIGKFKFIIAIIVFALGFYAYRKSIIKDVILFPVFTLLFFFIGLVFYWSGHIIMLKYYWFRLPDVMVSLFMMLIFSKLIQDGLPAVVFSKIRMDAYVRRKNISMFMVAVLVTVYLFRLYQDVSKPGTFLTKYAQDGEMTTWIKEHTDKESKFIVDAGYQDFYINAERAILVAFKHLPQSNEEIINWHNRMIAINNGKHITTVGWEVLGEVNKNYRALSESSILKISNQYDMDYIVAFKDMNLDFPLLYESKKYKLYKIIDHSMSDSDSKTHLQ